MDALAPGKTSKYAVYEYWRLCGHQSQPGNFGELWKLYGMEQFPGCPTPSLVTILTTLLPALLPTFASITSTLLAINHHA
jgi:hypothetical protein